MPARSTAALIATAPSSLAASDAKSPWNPPIGVRAAPTITTGSLSTVFPHARNALFRLVEQLTANQHAPDLGRPGADLVQLRIAPQASGRIVVDIAVTAQRLDRLARHPRR